MIFNERNATSTEGARYALNEGKRRRECGYLNEREREKECPIKIGVKKRKIDVSKTIGWRRTKTYRAKGDEGLWCKRDGELRYRPASAFVLHDTRP